MNMILKTNDFHFLALSCKAFWFSNAWSFSLSRKVAPSYLSSPLAVQATFPFVWVAGDVPDLKRLSKGFSLWGGPTLLRFPSGPWFLQAKKHGVLKSWLQQCQMVLSAKKPAGSAGLLKFVRRADLSAQPCLFSTTLLRPTPESSCAWLRNWLHTSPLPHNCIMFESH